MQSVVITFNPRSGLCRAVRPALNSLWMAAILALVAHRATALTIDDFTAAGITKQPPGVMRSSVGSTTVTDASLTGAIGGSRQLTVAMTFAATAADYVSAGASTAFGALDYSSTAGGNGRFEL